jgi:hypothetical protein
MVNPNYKFKKSHLSFDDLKNVAPCTRELHIFYMQRGKLDDDSDIMVALRPRTSAWPKRDESSNGTQCNSVNCTIASSCKLLENLICFSLITLSKCAFCLTSSLPCILHPYTLFFLTNMNMAVEVEKTRDVVGFPDPEWLCSTTLNSTKNTLAFSVSYMCNAFSYMLKRISSLSLISV